MGWLWYLAVNVHRCGAVADLAQLADFPDLLPSASSLGHRRRRIMMITVVHSNVQCRIVSMFGLGSFGNLM